MSDKPLGADTRMAQKIGAAMAREMAKHQIPKAEDIPAHRWGEKLSRFRQRLVLVGLVVLSVKLAWPWYVTAGCALMAARALSPELTESTVRWMLSVLRNGRALKNGNGGNGTPPTVGPTGTT